MEIFNQLFVQLGAIGLMLFGLIWFSRYLFKYMMGQVKEINKENKVLEAEFRDYLIQQSKEHHELLEKNTEAFTRLINFFEGSFVNYLKERSERQREQNEAIEDLISQLS